MREFGLKNYKCHCGKWDQAKVYSEKYKSGLCAKHFHEMHEKEAEMIIKEREERELEQMIEIATKSV